MYQVVETLQGLVFGVPNFIWVTFVCILAAYIWGTYPYTQLKYLGIPGPKPTPFLGNLPEMWIKNHMTMDNKLINKYGKISSFYLGRYPAVTVADPDILKQILTKEFPVFINRSKLMPGDEISKAMILIARDEQWKFLRTILSPNFSKKKLRGMVSLIDKAVSNVEKTCEAHAESGDEMNIKSLFSTYTVEVIGATLFGIKIDSENDAAKLFVKNARINVEMNRTNSFFLLSYICNPLFRIIGFFFLNYLVPSRKFLVDFCWNVFGDRKKAANKDRLDFLQMMINTQQECNSSEETNGAVTTEPENANQKTPIHKRKFTDREIIANCLVFYMAGYETTASSLGYMVHSLALNPDIQKKVQEEINEVLGDEPADYENVQKLPYLEQCISETLRIYPVICKVSREAGRDITINNWYFPKHTKLIIPIYAMHHNPEFWPEPEKFDPERFSAEGQKKHVPFTYLPFGRGPRMCIASRLAELEMKIVMAQILRKYRFLPCDKTEDPIVFKKCTVLVTLNDIYLKVEKL